jgi:hypothetical protein
MSPGGKLLSQLLGIPILFNLRADKLSCKCWNTVNWLVVSLLGNARISKLFGSSFSWHFFNSDTKNIGISFYLSSALVLKFQRIKVLFTGLEF